MNLHVKKGDNVLIIAGKDKGNTGKITSVDPDAGRVIVDGYNIITKHTKPRGANAPGGINKVPGPIDASNVQVICDACKKATRIDHKDIDGKNVRVCSKCGASLDEKKAEKKAAKKAAAKADKSEKASEVVAEPKAKKTTAAKTEKVAEVATEDKPKAKKAAPKKADKAE